MYLHQHHPGVELPQFGETGEQDRLTARLRARESKHGRSAERQQLPPVQQRSIDVDA